MKHYVMFENISDCKTTVVTLETSLDVMDFIENKINECGYRLEDFQVIQGTPLNLKTILTPIYVQRVELR